MTSLHLQAPVPVTEDVQRNQMTSTTSAPGSPQEAIEVRTENLFQRTEVLAGTKPCGPPKKQKQNTHTHTLQYLHICKISGEHLLPSKSKLASFLPHHPHPKIMRFFFLINSFSFPQWDPVKFTALCVCVLARSRLCAHHTL